MQYISCIELTKTLNANFVFKVFPIHVLYLFIVVITRRGDMEILAFNIVHWLSSKLPWEGLNDCVLVQKAKESAMQNVTVFLKDCFGKKPIPGE